MAGDREMRVSEKELETAGVALAFRDYCAHLLLPLNQCRRSTFYMPWKCSEERHAYEKCEYEEFARRLKDPSQAHH